MLIKKQQRGEELTEEELELIAENTRRGRGEEEEDSKGKGKGGKKKA